MLVSIYLAIGIVLWVCYALSEVQGTTEYTSGFIDVLAFILIIVFWPVIPLIYVFGLLADVILELFT